MICDETGDRRKQSAASLRCNKDEAYLDVSLVSMDDAAKAALTERCWFLLVRKQLRRDRDALYNIRTSLVV